MHFGSLPYKTKQFFFVLIKLSIVVGAFYFIYHKLTDNRDLDFKQFLAFLSEKNVFSFKNISFLVILSSLNWFFEILKWRTLVNSVSSINFTSATEQSLGSLTASLLTPNRIGEYGAKAMYYHASKRKQIMLLNLLGNVMQMSITVIFGVIGCYVMYSKYDLNINYYKVIRLIMIILTIAFIALFTLKQDKFKIKGFSLERLKHFFSQLSKQLIFKTFWLSAIRYLIFSFQFYYLLLMFGVDVSYFNAMVVITTMYLLASVIPAIFIFDVIIKGSVAIYLFTIVGVNEFTVLSIITLMWLLNFVLPSILGSYYVLNFKLSKAKP
ncbi:lysylphosphatidylglycerol synthase domain-containing protein [Psychroserpens sp. BH13MA-6]